VEWKREIRIYAVMCKGIELLGNTKCVSVEWWPVKLQGRGGWEKDFTKMIGFKNEWEEGNEYNKNAKMYRYREEHVKKGEGRETGE
jgi:hypothetical protein